MPAWDLPDEDIANVLTYVYNKLGQFRPRGRDPGRSAGKPCQAERNRPRARALAVLSVAAWLATPPAVATATPRHADGAGAGRRLSSVLRESAGKGKTGSPAPARVAAFRLDVFPVTNGQFLDFVRQHPEWRRSRVKPLFADRGYLAKWRADLKLAEARAASEPVTNVSWFAAEAYCEARGLRLPTTEQWEYALADQGRDQAWSRNSRSHGSARPIPGISTPSAAARRMASDSTIWSAWCGNGRSTKQLHDRNGTAQHLRQGRRGILRQRRIGVRDAADYPAFMRYALRTSLKAAYTVDNVGFRCEGDE